MESIVSPFLEATAHDPLDRWRRSRRELGSFVFEDRGHGFGGRFAAERALPREHLVQHETQREDVGAVIDRFPADLFGRHVANSTDDGAGVRDGIGDRRESVGARHQRQFRDAEVENLQAAIASEKQVLGLQITMDDATLMRRGEPARDLHAILNRRAFRHRTVPQPLAERLALEQFRDDVRNRALAADVVDDQEVGMVECACGPRFGLEPLDALRVGGAGAGQSFDRHVPAEARVPGAIHLAHTAGADQAVDLVGAEPRSGRQHLAHRLISLLRRQE